MTKTGLQVVGFLVIPSFLAAASGDESAFPAVGSRIRVRALRSGSLVGTLSAVDDTYLTVVRTDKDAASVVARLDVTGLERSVKPSRKGRGALLGLAIGFGVGYVAAATLGNCSETPGVVDHCGNSVWSSITGAMAGAAGAGIGALVAPGERWVEVPLTRERSSASKAGRALLRVVPLAGASRGALVSVFW